MELHPRRLVVGISGASGVILGVRILELLKQLEIETHLIISAAGEAAIEAETNWKRREVEELADITYEHGDIGAAISSGSFPTDGMIVIPCSIKTLSAIANSYADNLLSRAADVTLKEGRPLLLVVREAPLHSGHLDLMRKVAGLGGVIYPPVPAFYTGAESIEAMVDNLAGRILARMGIENDFYRRWKED